MQTLIILFYPIYRSHINNGCRCQRNQALINHELNNTEIGFFILVLIVFTISTIYTIYEHKKTGGYDPDNPNIKHHFINWYMQECGLRAVIHLPVIAFILFMLIMFISKLIGLLL